MKFMNNLLTNELRRLNSGTPASADQWSGGRPDASCANQESGGIKYAETNTERIKMILSVRLSTSFSDALDIRKIGTMMIAVIRAASKTA